MAKNRDNRANQSNPNNPAHKAAQDNRANQSNPNNPAHKAAQAGISRPAQWRESTACKEKVEKRSRSASGFNFLCG